MKELKMLSILQKHQQNAQPDNQSSHGAEKRPMTINIKSYEAKIFT